MDYLVPYALIAIGMFLMAVEFFLPTGGILFVLGIGGLLAGVAMSFAASATQGLVTLIALFILVPLFSSTFLQFWRRTKIGKQLILEGADEDDTIAKMPVNLELEQLRNRYGKTVSSLRPAGITDFDGKRIDTLSEGDMIDPGQWVRCIDVRAGRVIVRRVEKPPSLDNIDLTS